MSEEDLKLELLSGSKGCLNVGNLSIHPYTLQEIKEYGYSNYMLNLQWLSLTVDDFIKSVLDIDKRVYLEAQKSKLKTFDFYIKLGGQQMLDGLLIALAMIFKTDDIRVLDDYGVAIDLVKMGVLVEDEDGDFNLDNDRLEELSDGELKVVNRDNFDDIVEAVKLQNYLKKPKENKDEDINPADEETKKLMERMKELNEKVKEKKRQQTQGEDEEINISDIVSAVTAKSNSINKLNVWDHTLYQLYDEYARLELIDNYDFSIRAMMAGAEKIDLKHWSSKI
ncbi:hypothetical protein FKN04_12385 [Bacillus glycinifermentans]|uniref:hypothetical protein n=1 Tax=Bacillus glycinifermentans TaxID=1664069 RepID=UPI001582373C|nr:hypothetical protein [Bacillus glycinifermentans]NUJ17378.1 hypothetical protein [Bacillus glycinifermentans]